MKYGHQKPIARILSILGDLVANDNVAAAVVEHVPDARRARGVGGAAVLGVELAHVVQRRLQPRGRRGVRRVLVAAVNCGLGREVFEERRRAGEMRHSRPGDPSCKNRLSQVKQGLQAAAQSWPRCRTAAVSCICKKPAGGWRQRARARRCILGHVVAVGVGEGAVGGHVADPAVVDDGLLDGLRVQAGPAHGVVHVEPVFIAVRRSEDFCVTGSFAGCRASISGKARARPSNTLNALRALKKISARKRMGKAAAACVAHTQ